MGPCGTCELVWGSEKASLGNETRKKNGSYLGRDERAWFRQREQYRQRPCAIQTKAARLGSGVQMDTQSTRHSSRVTSHHDKLRLDPGLGPLPYETLCLRKPLGLIP